MLLHVQIVLPVPLALKLAHRTHVDSVGPMRPTDVRLHPVLARARVHTVRTLVDHLKRELYKCKKNIYFFTVLGDNLTSRASFFSNSQIPLTKMKLCTHSAGTWVDHLKRELWEFKLKKL